MIITERFKEMSIMAGVFEIPIFMRLVIGPSDMISNIESGSGPYHSSEASNIQAMFMGMQLVNDVKDLNKSFGKRFTNYLL
jgi:hypothetical protein